MAEAQGRVFSDAQIRIIHLDHGDLLWFEIGCHCARNPSQSASFRLAHHRDIVTNTRTAGSSVITQSVANICSFSGPPTATVS